MALTTVTGLITTLEGELGHIVNNDYTVAALQTFVSKNSHQLHSKHYLNILGKWHLALSISNLMIIKRIFCVAQKHMMMILSDQKTLNRASAKKIIQLGKSIKVSQFIYM